MKFQIFTHYVALFFLLRGFISTHVAFFLFSFSSSFSTAVAAAAGAILMASSAEAFVPHAFHHSPALLRSTGTPALRATSGLKLSMNVSF